MKIAVLLFSLVLISAAFSYEDATKSLGLKLSPVKALRVADPIPWPFTVCGTGKWTITNLYLSNQPTPYLQFDFYWIGKANAKIDFDYVNIEVSYNGTPIGALQDPTFTDSFDAGDDIQYARGISATSPFPAGKIGMKFEWFNVAGLKEGCAEFSFQL